MLEKVTNMYHFVCINKSVELVLMSSCKDILIKYFITKEIIKIE